MEKVIVYKRPDGSCGVIHPAPEMFDKDSRTRQAIAAQGIRLKDDPDEILHWIAHKDVPEGMPWRVAARASLPADRTFRNAWTDSNPTDTVDVEMEKARAIHMDRLRKTRDEKIKALDVPYMRALESGTKAEQNAIAAKKQQLRDMPDKTDLSELTTPAELAAFVPDSLKA